MCKGTTTKLTCGHALISYKNRCCSSTNPLKKAQCPGVIGDSLYLNDTCASCHPPFLMAEINRRYDSLKDSLVRSLRRARSEDVRAELQRALEEASRERSKELRAAGMLKWSGVVLWGPEGANGEERGEYTQYREPWTVY